MGLTGSFFFVQNKGTTLEQLQETLNTQPFLQPRKLYSFAAPPPSCPLAPCWPTRARQPGSRFMKMD